jgi:hypothetical protein
MKGNSLLASHIEKLSDNCGITAVFPKIRSSDDQERRISCDGSYRDGNDTAVSLVIGRQDGHDPGWTDRIRLTRILKMTPRKNYMMSFGGRKIMTKFIVYILLNSLYFVGLVHAEEKHWIEGI